MNKKNCSQYACSTKYTIQTLRGKWKLHVIWQLMQQEKIRFNELQRQIDGISAVVLKRTLNELENDKIINREQYDETPPKVEYSLTSYGKDLIPIFQEMGEWGRRTSQERFDKI